MSTEFVGAVTLEWNGLEIECLSVNTDIKTGRKIVKTMNRTGKPAGHSKGVAEFSLSVEVPIPSDGSEPDWLAIDDAKVTIVSIDDTGPREAYIGCVVESMSGKYMADDTAVRSLSITALDRRVTQS